MNTHRWYSGKMLRLVAITLLISGAGQVRAQSTLFDNLSATSSGTDPIGSFGPLADSFSTGATAVNVFDVKLLLNTSATTGSFTVSLLSDSSTSPGSVLAVLGTLPDSALTGSLAIYDFPFSPISLSASTRYWIQLSTSDGSSAQWSWSGDISGPGVSGEFFANANGVFANTSGPYQMQVLAAVPEPTTWALIGIGTIGAGAYAWRKKRLATKAGMAKLKV